MVDCRHVQPLWKEALKFCEDVLGLRPNVTMLEAVVFNVYNDRGKWVIIPEASRAFLRHVVKYWYADMTSVITKKIIFKWQLTFHKALLSFKDAVLRRCFQIKKMYATRMYSNLHEVVPEDERERFNTLVKIQANGRYTLTQNFIAAIAAARAAI